MSFRLCGLLALALLLAAPCADAAAGRKKKRRADKENKEKPPLRKRLSFDMGPVSGTKVDAAQAGGSTEKGASDASGSAPTGSVIAFEDGKGHALTNHRQLYEGPKDKPPPPNPQPGTSGSASGRTAITPNQP